MSFPGLGFSLLSQYSSWTCQHSTVSFKTSFFGIKSQCFLLYLKLLSWWEGAEGELSPEQDRTPSSWPETLAPTEPLWCTVRQETRLWFPNSRMLFIMFSMWSVYCIYDFSRISPWNISCRIILPPVSSHSPLLALAFLTEIPCLQGHKELF